MSVSSQTLTRTPQSSPVEGSWALRPDARASARSRQLVRDSLNAWGLAEHSDAAELLTSELIGNTLRHADGPRALRITHRYGILRCEVEDTSTQLPEPQEADDNDESGRGMEIIDALATRWGSDRTATGKTVWFELTDAYAAA